MMTALDSPISAWHDAPGQLLQTQFPWTVDSCFGEMPSNIQAEIAFSPITDYLSTMETGKSQVTVTYRKRMMVFSEICFSSVKVFFDNPLVKGQAIYAYIKINILL